MHKNFQQFDLQMLIDLLAEETEKYTKAFISGDQKKTAKQKAVIDALVEEINIRKRTVTDIHKSEIPSERI
jgi:alpha-D-ribose 1-methylphosphonate 5-triphosphate synthase subunit PhnG